MTQAESLRRTLEFALELDKLKAVSRRTKPVGLERYENSAEHSWHVCLLALVLADRAAEEIDIGRVVEMLLVHDIPEIDAGDRYVYDPASEDHAATERGAARRLFGLLPEPHATVCFERWEEFTSGGTPDARFARAVDRLMPVLQNLANGGQSWRENGVGIDQVLSINAGIADAAPSVWEEVRRRLREAESRGLFRA
ncbi:MAG TPA: HD domain-containing protein [Acidobacteriota bacterium]|nr:HD domain-containing protein [Acidobacteriota bacterium]